MNMLDVKNLKKIYKTRFSGNQVEALSGVSFTIRYGEYTAIMGESGSGKTTLLNILASLDTPTEGTVMLNGKKYADITDEEISALYFKILICWTPLVSRIISSYRWYYPTNRKKK